jgi:anti-anti-sigma factor
VLAERQVWVIVGRGSRRPSPHAFSKISMRGGLVTAAGVCANSRGNRHRHYSVFMGDGFSTTVSRDGDAILIYVAGEIDIATVERLRDAIEPHLGPQQTIILDLSGVEFMDSSCINLLVQARGTLTADGGSLFLRDPSVAAHRLVTIMGLEDLLHKDADTQRD